MKHILYSFSSLVISALVFAATSHAQSVYFQRIDADFAGLSSIPLDGSSGQPVDIADHTFSSVFGGIASNGLGSFYLSDAGAGTIKLADVSGKLTEVVSSAAGLSNPQALSYDVTGNFLYIADVGNQRIVRADLSQKLPVSSVEVVATSGQIETIFNADLKFNSADGLLYISNGVTLYRLNPAAALPAVAEELTFTPELSVGYFDFDNNTPQSIFLVSLDDTSRGIHRATLPPAGVTSASATQVLDISADADTLIFGIALQKDGQSMCFNLFDGISTAIVCGDRSGASGFLPLVTGQAFATTIYLLIDSTVKVVTPATVPAAPSVSVSVSGNKTQALLTFEAFSLLADSKKKKSLRLLAAELEEAKKKSPKLQIRYAVEIKRPTDASGAPLSAKEQDKRKLLSKRNQLTVKNLKANSNYEVKYRAELFSKTPGGGTKVVKKSAFSPTTTFTIQ